MSSPPGVRWLGSQRLSDLLNPPALMEDNLRLVLLHGTWNVGRRNNKSSTTTTTDGYFPREKELLTSWIQHAAIANVNADSSSWYEYSAATVEIDLDDDATCNLLIEGKGGDAVESHHHHRQKQLLQPLPIPPAELPALALVLHHPSRGGVVTTLRYVSSDNEVVKPLRLLDALNGGVKTATLHSATISDVVQTVMMELLLEDSREIQVGHGTLLPVQQEQDCSSTTEEEDTTDDEEDALRIFVAGDRSSVGKSSVCLGILGSLLRMGYPAQSLAYIKPATQSESTQLIQLYCKKHGITCVPIGPLVYYRGFTRAFLAGETESTKTLLKSCQQAVDQVARGRRFVLVDGVGFPAVGSICGTDNVAVLCACSYPRIASLTTTTTTTDDSDDRLDMNRKPMGVVLVGGSGVGAAVDAFNLNACYFEQRHVPVLGAIFNKLSDAGFYSLENCKAEISKYFDQQQQQQQHESNGNLQQPKRGRPFGFLPLFPAIAGDKAMDHVEEFLSIFASRVDVAAILNAARQVKARGDDSFTSSVKTLAAPGNKTSNGTNTTRVEQTNQQSPTKRRKLIETSATTVTSSAAPKKSRQEIEGIAIAGGAAPSA